MFTAVIDSTDMRLSNLCILALVALGALFTNVSGFQVRSLDLERVNDAVIREKRQLETFESEDYPSGISAANQEAPEESGFWDKFYIIINLAVGGTNGFFPDNIWNPMPKPWSNTSPRALTDFWNGRANWLPTWNLGVNDGQDASLQVDYVRVWAL